MGVQINYNNMANVSEIKNGLCIILNNDIWTIIEFLHVKPGKGPAFVRTKLKSLKSGKVVDNTFPGSAKLVTARIERKSYQYLYNDGETFYFMDTQTFEQTELPSNQVPNNQFLKEGDNVDVLIHAEEDKLLGVELPQHVVLEITYSEPGVKGDTATNATKPATLETGAKINVPLFVNEGDKIKIDTKTGSYVERVK